ncbi:hypothetical protein NDU88_005998 [Pleurodeles waltl]|uniref:Uncharacterized protein n=1 Tax=Pleurodeles waltl TaxID=8319 RepID=A0AAV7WWA6_PLEWA|nr:hypothetical protein NDU88_005998 [Pleurodeles waltl]
MRPCASTEKAPKRPAFATAPLGEKPRPVAETRCRIDAPDWLANSVPPCPPAAICEDLRVGDSQAITAEATPSEEALLGFFRPTHAC